MVPRPVRIEMSDRYHQSFQSRPGTEGDYTNVSSLKTPKQEMNRLNVNLVGEQETRWASNGDFTSDTLT